MALYLTEFGAFWLLFWIVIVVFFFLFSSFTLAIPRIFLCLSENLLSSSFLFPSLSVLFAVSIFQCSLSITLYLVERAGVECCINMVHWLLFSTHAFFFLLLCWLPSDSFVVDKVWHTRKDITSVTGTLEPALCRALSHLSLNMINYKWLPIWVEVGRFFIAICLGIAFFLFNYNCCSDQTAPI